MTPSKKLAANSSECTADGPQSSHRWRVLAVLLTGIFMALMAVSIVNVALPSIQYGLQARDADIQWVLSGFALSFGVVLVAAGRAGDLLGRGGLYILGMSIYTVGFILAVTFAVKDSYRWQLGIIAGYATIIVVFLLCFAVAMKDAKLGTPSAKLKKLTD